MKKTLCLTLLILGAMTAIGQSLTNLDFTFLATIKGNEIATEKIPIQIALVSYDHFYGEEGEDLRYRVEDLANQAEQHLTAQAMKEVIKTMEEGLVTMNKQRDECKNDPALLNMLDENIKLAKEKIADLKASNTTVEPYTQSPTQLTKEVLAIAVNHRFYSHAEKLDNDNWIVCDGNRLNDDPENKNQEWYFHYGIIDPSGKTLIPCIYHIRGVYEEKDIYYVWKKENGKVCGGAINGHNKVIIPFDYADVRTLDSEHNLVLIEGHNGLYGLMNMEGKLLQPTEYEDYYATDNGFFFTKGDKTFFVDYNGKALER